MTDLVYCSLVTDPHWRSVPSTGDLSQVLEISPHCAPSPLCYLLSELAGLVWAVEDLVVKYGEVESQAEPDGVGRLHLGFADFKCVLVSLLRIVNDS